MVGENLKPTLLVLTVLLATLCQSTLNQQHCVFRITKVFGISKVFGIYNKRAKAETAFNNLKQLKTTTDYVLCFR